MQARTGGAVQLVEYLPSMRKNLGLIPSTALEPGIVALTKNPSTLGGESKKIRNSGHPQYAESLRLAWLSWRPYFKKQHKPKKQKIYKNDYSGQCNLNVKGRCCYRTETAFLSVEHSVLFCCSFPVLFRRFYQSIRSASASVFHPFM